MLRSFIFITMAKALRISAIEKGKGAASSDFFLYPVLAHLTTAIHHLCLQRNLH